jgi:effector-binding domain-containing protein
MDPGMKLVYSGPAEGKGASYTWTSDHDKVGNGKQTISDSKPYEYVLMDMEFMEGGPARCGFYFQKTDGGTEVKWTMDTDAGWNIPARYFGLLADYFVGPHFEDGLASLAAEAGKVAQQGYSMGFEPVNFPGMKLLFLRYSCQESEIGNSLGMLYGTLMESMGKQKLQMAGPPVAFYEGPEGKTFRFSAGIPVDKNPENVLNSGEEFMEIPAGKALLCRFNGAYQKTGAAYAQFEKEMKSRGLRPAGAPWESYVSDPQTIKDPMAVRTEIYWPVAEAGK